MKRISVLWLSWLLALSGQPASAATYNEVLDFGSHGKLTLKISQAGRLVDEVYILESAGGATSLLVNEALDIELTSQGPSRFLGALYRENLPSTKVCNLRVGLGEVSAMPLEEDPSRWLGEIPLQITWEEKKLDFFNLFYWQASASGRVSGLVTKDMGLHSKLQFHVDCDGQVLDTFSYSFYKGLKSLPRVPEPQLTLKNNLATVNLGEFDTYKPLGTVSLTFFECRRVPDECYALGEPHKYLSFQVTGPLEFSTSGLSLPYLVLLAEMENDFGVTRKASNSITVAGTISRTYTLPQFVGRSSKLSNSQKTAIKAELAKLAGLSKVRCVAYILKGQSSSERARAQSRAREVCQFVRGVAKGVSTLAVTQTSQSRTNANKVILEISN